MQKWISDWFNALTTAWKKQMLLPLPEALSKRRSSKNEYEMGAFVLLGFFAALFAVLAGGITELFFNRFGGSLVFALTGWLLLLFHDHGRGDGLIASKLADMLPGDVIPFRIVMPVFMVILKFLLLLLLFMYGSRFFFTFICSGIFAMEVLLIKEAGFSPPVVNESEKSVWIFWAAAAVVVVLNFLFLPLGCALGALAFAGILRFIRIREMSGNHAVDHIRYAGALTGWVMLFCGVFSI